MIRRVKKISWKEGERVKWRKRRQRHGGEKKREGERQRGKTGREEIWRKRGRGERRREAEINGKETQMRESEEKREEESRKGKIWENVGRKKGRRREGKE